MAALILNRYLNSKTVVKAERLTGYAVDTKPPSVCISQVRGELMVKKHVGPTSGDLVNFRKCFWALGDMQPQPQATHLSY